MESGDDGMIKSCVLLNGQVINIGDWDYQYEQVEVTPAVVDEETKEIITPAEYETVARNPLPEGAIIEEVEVTQNADGGWVRASDYAALRRAEYPNYSPYDLLDEVLKHITPTQGSKLEQMMQERNAVKAKYPKPE